MYEGLTGSYLALLALLSVIPSGAARGDHCSEKLEAPGKPDTQLAGVPVLKGAVLKVTEHLGAPTAVETFPDDNYPGSGERQYSWQRRFERVVVATMFAPPNAGVGPETPYSVELFEQEGLSNTSARRLATARGLILGATRSAVIAKYGPRFLEETIEGHPTLSYCWSNDTWLSFEFTSDGLVKHIQLLGSVE